MALSDMRCNENTSRPGMIAGPDPFCAIAFTDTDSYDFFPYGFLYSMEEHL